jgi:uncharacterized protein YciI
MKYFALLYHVGEDYLARRTQYRQDHLRLAGDAALRGDLVLGGALGDPYDTALLIFRVPEKTIVEQFVHNDPYFIHGLVQSWEIREWDVVVGSEKK